MELSRSWILPDRKSSEEALSKSKPRDPVSYGDASTRGHNEGLETST